MEQFLKMNLSQSCSRWWPIFPNFISSIVWAVKAVIRILALTEIRLQVVNNFRIRLIISHWRVTPQAETWLARELCGSDPSIFYNMLCMLYHWLVLKNRSRYSCQIFHILIKLSVWSKFAM